jgi:hypothetical protein
MSADINEGEELMKSQNELGKNPGFLRELLQFISQNKKWYLVPVIVAILFMAILIILGSTGAVPFIYTLF